MKPSSLPTLKTMTMLTECLLKGISMSLLLAVAIEVCGDAELRVPEGHADLVAFDAGGGQQARGRLSQIVEPHAWNAWIRRGMQ